MNITRLALLLGAVGVLVTAIVLGDDVPGMNMLPGPPSATQPSTRPTQAVDLRNTICPVSGDKVGNSAIVEVYDGKVYHLCCSDCPADFEKDPAKYAKAVADNPAKYGVK
jgi:YHS domain-containing protein